MSHAEQPWMDRDASLVQLGERDADEDSAFVRLGRRGFLTGLGISGAIAVSGCDRLPVRKALPYLIPPEEIVPGVPVPYASTCAGCSAACGLLVNTRDSRPIKLEGLPSHPLSDGGLCATGQAELRGLYDSGRLQKPRVNNADVDWSALDKHVAGKLAAASKPVLVLSHTLASPTARAALSEFAKKHGGELVEYDPPATAASATGAAYRLLDGNARVPALSFAETQLLVTLGADLLGAGPSPVEHASRYTARRDARAEGGSFRHVAIEGSVSLTGAAADDRWSATTAQRSAIVQSLLHRVCRASDSPLAKEVLAAGLRDSTVGQLTERVTALATALLAAGTRALLVSGSDRVGDQVAIALINRILGSSGLDRAAGRDTPDSTRLASWLERLKAGQLGGIVVVSANPVEELPDGEAIAKAIGSAGLSVCITDRPTATAAACGAVAAAHHALESWGDAQPKADVFTVQQPTIRPIFDTRHPIENVLLWSGAAVSDYRLHLQGSWSKRLWSDAADAQQRWNAALSRGSAQLVAPAAPAPAADGQTSPPADEPTTTAAAAPDGAGSLNDAVATVGRGSDAPAETLEIELVREVGLREGRNSFNPWVRELPDPLTRVSWSAAARLAPKRADALGVKDGDEIQIKVGEATVKMPVRILPGQHADVIGVPVGYGLVDGDGAATERNGYRLASWQNGHLIGAGLTAQLSVAGSKVELPIMQPHPSAEGRPIIHEVASSTDAVPALHHAAHSLWDEHEYTTHWEMVIDLDKCNGCSACVISCQAENNLPVVGPTEMARHRDMYWLRIDRYYAGDENEPDVMFEPMMCAQCDNAPCETVCPVAATVHSSDGLNQQAYNRCVGTRYCANNCPYKARRFNWLDYTPKDPVERLALNPDVVVRERGIMEKCTFCVQRIQRARIDAKKRGEPVPANPQTACQQSCPAKAISFGDGAQKASGLADLQHKPRAFRVLEDLGVKPSLAYLARIRQKDSSDEGSQG